MYLKGVFNLKLYIIGWYLSTLKWKYSKNLFDRWKNLDFSKFDLKINRLLNSVNLEYFQKTK